MSPSHGRPPISNPKNVRLEIRLTEEQAETLAECADRLKTSRTEVINKGVAMVKAELDKNRKPPCWQSWRIDSTEDQPIPKG